MRGSPEVFWARERVSGMKRVVTVLLVLGLSLSFAGCGVKQEEYDKVVSESAATSSDLESAKAQLTDVTAELDKLKTDYEKTVGERDTLKKEYEAYQEKMKPFEEMTAAQAEAEKLKAEKEKEALEEEKKAKAEAEAKAAAEAEAKAQAEKEAEEAKGYETGITYEQIARTPDDYKGQKVKFTGKVIQVIEGDTSTQIRLAVDSDYDTVLLGEFDKSIVTSRVLDDDIITIYGSSVGVISYQSTMGGTITIPGVLIDKLEFAE